MVTRVTLDNIANFLPCIDKSDDNHLYGLVDIGSNGIRFSVSDLSTYSPRLLTCVYLERVGISLYDALHETGPDAKDLYFSPTTISQVSKALGRFQRIWKAHGVLPQNTIIFATEALRTAKNKDEMLRAIREASGSSASLLSPKVEGLLGAMGARSEFADADGLFLDLGGGSVQITYINTKMGLKYEIRAAETSHSLPFGAAKLSRALEDPESAEAATKDLHAKMMAAVKSLEEQFPTLRTQMESDKGVNLYLCGGGFRGYGSMLMHTDVIRPYPISEIGGYRVPGSRFRQWQEMKLANDSEGPIYGMSHRRRRQFPAIALVVKSLVEAVPRINSVIFCSGGNREGALFMKLPPNMREADPFPHILTPKIYRDPSVLSFITNLLRRAIPSSCPALFETCVLHYIVRNIWIDQGLKNNASRALGAFITNIRHDLPSLDHQVCALLSLTLSARWNLDLGNAEAQVSRNLQKIIGDEMTWWCRYIGTACKFLATIFPIFPGDCKSIVKTLSWDGVWSNSLGKKGKKEGILLNINLDKEWCDGILDLTEKKGSLKKMWKKINHGIDFNRKVAVKIQMQKE